MIQVDAEELGQIKRILGGLGTISKETMIEQSSKAGNKTRLAVRRAFLRENTEWTQDYIGGRRVLRTANGSMPQALGIRIAHRKGGGIDAPSNMANFITSFTHETTGTTVVGGTHKGFRPPKIQNGKIVGRMGRVGGVSQQTVAILEKLNYGNRSGEFADKLEWRGKKDSIKQFEGKWKPRRFFEKGWSQVKGQVIGDMTTELERLIGQRANNVDLSKEKQYAV